MISTTLSKLLRRNKSYLLAYFAVLAVGLLYFAFEGHGQLVLKVNENRTALLDAIMPALTFIGDGIFFALVITVMLLWNWRLGVLFAAAGTSALILSAILKRVVFPDVVRPKAYFEGKVALQMIEGVEVHGKFSFPSGHTLSVFTMLTLIAFIFSHRRWLALSALVFAWIVAFSRIYLLQHFLVDILAGSFIGLLIALSTFVLLGRWAKATEFSQRLQS